MDLSIETLKHDTAKDIVRDCLGSHGVWAGSGRYAHMNWTRDFAFATMPYLVAAMETSVVRRHLANLSLGQRLNGQIPILFLDGPLSHARFLADKIRKSLNNRKLSFMLRRYLSGNLWNLTPGTRDSEILYLHAMGEYRKVDPYFVAGFEKKIERAFDYVLKHVMSDGLVVGADWRDTMEAALANQRLLTNNALFYGACRLHRKDKIADALKQHILETFFKNDRVIDYPGSDRFDPLGGAFAVLEGVADRSHYPLLVEMFRSVDSPTGVTIKCRHNPLTFREADAIEETDGVVTWPFVVGFTVLALLAMNETVFAEEQFAKMVAHDGFREYYHPRTGEGFGETEQLWSAVLYLRAHAALYGIR